VRTGKEAFGVDVGVVAPLKLILLAHQQREADGDADAGGRPTGGPECGQARKPLAWTWVLSLRSN
jgi:hypothetical protein